MDSCFNWPPDGGAQTDVRECAVRLARDNNVKIFAATMEDWLRVGSKRFRWPLDRTRFFWKGRIREPVGVEIELVPFGPLSFSAKGIGPRFKSAIEAWKPDHVWITQSWYLKPYLALALKDFKPVVRIYAHEMLCIKADGFLYRWGKACEKDYLRDGALTHLRCDVCTLGFYVSYPSPTWLHEFFAARAFLPSYRERVIESLHASRVVLVYNRSTADRVSPFAREVRIVPGGVDVRRFTPRHSTNGGFEGKKVILVPGRTEEKRKGFAVAVAAAECLRRSRSDFEIWTTDSHFKGAPGIRSIPWRSHSEMPDLYSQCDIVVIPSLWPEPFGMVTLEAMAAGLPVVASRIGGLADIFEDGIEGYHFAPGNADDLAEKLKLLLDDESKRVTMGISARRRVEERHDWDDIVKQYVSPLFPEP